MVLLKLLSALQSHTRRRAVLIVALLLQTQISSAAQISEYALKAALLYNFTQFVTWPESAFQSPDSPFQLCVAAEDPFGKTLDNVVVKERVNGHPIVVRRLIDPQNADACHILYIHSSSSLGLKQILDGVKAKPVLLVGEAPNFAAGGGTIALQFIDRRIRMQVNLHAARQANLDISSKLLRLSDVILEEQ